MPKNLIEIASEIVETQVSLAPMSASDITLSLRQVFNTLRELRRVESGEIDLPKTQEAAPAQVLTPKDSIQENRVICIECGAEKRQLSKAHSMSHGMNARDYKKKYGFTMRTSMAAKALSKAKSKAAKKRGLTEKLQKYMEVRRQAKAEATAQAVTETAKANKPNRTILRKAV
jgi:predicted transcriptional regulator